MSDLRNHFAEITREVVASKEPVFLTKNGVGSLVVMSMEVYEENCYESEVYDKLKEAELQTRGISERHSHEEVVQADRTRLENINSRRPRRA